MLFSRQRPILRHRTCQHVCFLSLSLSLILRHRTYQHVWLCGCVVVWLCGCVVIDFWTLYLPACVVVKVADACHAALCVFHHLGKLLINV